MKNIRDYNVGKSDYAKHTIQPWDIWKEYNLNPWDADIVKRVLRTKEGESRRLDYEKIIHICSERIRQIDAEDITDIEEDIDAEDTTDIEEDIDGTTVFCLSESDKPRYCANGTIFNVYSVFESRGHWYAYLGYNYSIKAHMYLSLTGTTFASVRIKDFPVPVILLSDHLDRVEHSSSVKIGAFGLVRYEIYDYLLNDGKLFRYMGAHEDGIHFKYARFNGYGDIEFIETRSRLINFANQITCGK